jgi:hypothetical protein
MESKHAVDNKICCAQQQEGSLDSAAEQPGQHAAGAIPLE